MITSLHNSIPTGLQELLSLGQPMTRCHDDILAFFDHPGTSNGPPKPSTASSNTPEEPPEESATSPNYITRSQLAADGFRPLIHLLLRRAI